MEFSKSRDLFTKALKFIPGGVHSPVRSFKGLHTTPVFIKRAQGAYLYDVDGNNYIDFCMSFGPLILGHGHPRVAEQISSAITRGWSYGCAEEYSLELAEYIIKRIPFIEQIRFVNSGTEAVMTAIRLARGFTAREKIIKFNGCYHGHMDGLLIKAGSGVRQVAEASSKGVPAGVAQDTLVFELGDVESLREIFNTSGDKIAAVIIEPLPANCGLLIQSADFLLELRKLTAKHGALLIFDEVISGFRIGFGGMSELLNASSDSKIIPDIVTYGKIIGGGLPVGAVAAKKKIMELLAPVGEVYQAGTLSANPLAMVAGLSTLKELTPDFYNFLQARSKKITTILNNFISKTLAGNITNFESLFWIAPSQSSESLVKITSADKIPSNISENFYIIFKALLERGVYLAPNAYEVGFISGAHDDTVIADLEKRLLY